MSDDNRTLTPFASGGTPKAEWEALTDAEKLAQLKGGYVNVSWCIARIEALEAELAALKASLAPSNWAEQATKSAWGHALGVGPFAKDVLTE